MAQQEEGWPLGLRLLNARMGLGRNNNGDFSGSVSFGTILTGSSTISTDDSSSDLDTQSTGSFFHDRSITLGSLIGISSFLQLSRRSTRGRMVMTELPSKDNNKNNNNKNQYKLIKPWLFSLCSRLNTDAISVHLDHGVDEDAPSLRQYLEAERRASSSTSTNHHRRRNHLRENDDDDDETIYYGPNDFSPIQEPNTLFVGGQVAAHHQSPNREWEESNRYGGAPIVFSCFCVDKK